MHGDESKMKDTQMMMQSHAHAYAYSCFLYFKRMAKFAQSEIDKMFFQKQ